MRRQNWGTGTSFELILENHGASGVRLELSVFQSFFIIECCGSKTAAGRDNFAMQCQDLSRRSMLKCAQYLIYLFSNNYNYFDVHIWSCFLFIVPVTVWIFSFWLIHTGACRESFVSDLILFLFVKFVQFVHIMKKKNNRQEILRENQRVNNWAECHQIIHNNIFVSWLIQQYSILKKSPRNGWQFFH